MIKSWPKGRGGTKKRHLISASFSSELFSILTMVSTISLCISGLLVALGMGKQHLLATTSIILVGVFFNSCILNIALYWYILGTSSLAKKTQINVSMKGFSVLGAIACFYLVAVCCMYFFTDSVLLTLAIPLAADIVLAVSITIGYFKLSRKLTVKEKMDPAGSFSSGGRLLAGRSANEGGMRFSQRRSFTSGRLHYHNNNGRSGRRISCVQLTGSSSGRLKAGGREGIPLDQMSSTTSSNGCSNNPPHPGGKNKSSTIILMKRIVSLLYLSFFCTIGIALAAMDRRCTTSSEAIMCCIFAFLDLWSVLSCCKIVFCCIDEKIVYKRTLAKHLSKNTATMDLLNVTKAKFSCLLKDFCSRKNQRRNQVCVAAEDPLPEHFLSLSSAASSSVFEGSPSPPAEGAKLNGQAGRRRRVAPFIVAEEEGERRSRSTQRVAPSANPPHQAATTSRRPLLLPGAAGFALGNSALIYDVVFFFSC